MKVRLLDCALAGALAGMASAAAAQDAGDTSALPAPAQPGAGGRAIAWPDGGVVWATEDPVPGERSLSLSVPSSVPFDGTRITAPVEFLARGNYPAFVARYEIAVYRANDADLVAPLAKVPVDVAAVSTARWDGALSAQSGLRTGDALVAVLRAYDAEGHFDETHPRAFQLVAPGSMPMHASHSTGLDATTSLDTALVAESFTHDGLRLRNIPLHGSRIRLQGRNLPPGLTLAIDGAAYPIDRERKFAAEFMVPVGRHDFEITTATQDGKPGPHRTLSLEVTGKYFFGVGLADVTIAHRHVGESVQAPSDQDEWLQQGRLAFYAKAKWRGTYLLTAQADTTERELDQLFDGFGQADPRDIFRRLDPDLYYPTHGDDSTTWRDVDTMGHFYLRLDWDQNQALWGNYATGFTGTELGQYVRSLYGAAVDWRSPGTTAWGDAATTLRAFGSEAQTAPGHNEFLGTGGSLYYLRHTDLLPGSDVVVLEVRDLASGRTESRVRLQRGADYEIDELQGRVLLTRPLAQITRQNLATLTRDAPLDGFEQRLVVDYEWVPSGFDADDIAAGVRAHHWFGDHLGAGVTYVDEIRAGQDYTLAAGDLTLQAGQGTWLKAEYAQSESFGAPVFVSDNGGFSFEQINDTATHREGNARSIDAHVNFRELGWTQRDWSAGAWWRNVGADFAANNFASGLPLSEYGVELLGSLSPALRLHARFSHAESGSDLRLQAQGTLEWRIDDRNTLAGEVRRVDETSSAGASAGVLGALRYTRRIGTASDVYGLVQRTLDDDHGRYADNDALVVGAHHRFADTASLGADLSTGDRGNAASVEGEYRVGAAHTFYGGYTTSTDTPQAPSPFDPKQDDGWTLGQRWRLSDRVTVHNESHYLKEPLQSGLAHTFGLDFLPAQGWNVGMTLQSGELEGSTGLVDRRAASLGGGHQTPATDWHSTLEWRRDTGAEQREQWVGTHRFAYRVNQSWRIAARLNHADTDDHLNAAAGARLVEGNLGFAYRPWNHTRWALFGRYTWLYDLATLAQQGGADVDQKTQVLSFEGVYAHDARWEYAARLARRTGDVRYGRGTGPWFDSGTDFAAAQVRYGLRSHWHALVEYRWQQVDHGGAQRGFLAGVDRDIGPHLRLGAGYNFTDFSDDLTEFGRGHRGWFLDISGRY